MSTFLKMSDLQIKTLYSQINKIKIELSANDDVKYRQKKQWIWQIIILTE